MQVEQNFLTKDQVDRFVKEIVDIIELCRDHPRAALAVAVDGLSVQGSARSSAVVEDEIDGVADSACKPPAESVSRTESIPCNDSALEVDAVDTPLQQASSALDLQDAAGVAVSEVSIIVYCPIHSASSS
jgi:hypothetical protein